MYRYFESKTALFSAVLADIRDALQKRILEAEGGGAASGRDHLAAFMSAAVLTHEEDVAYSRVLATALVDGFREPEFARVIEPWASEIRDVLHDLVEQVAAEEGTPSSQAPGITDLLLATLWGLAAFGAFMAEDEDVGEAMDVLIRRVLPALFNLQRNED